MAIGQIKIIRLLSKSEEEFYSSCFFPVTIAIYLICGFENNNRRKVFILREGIISPENIFLLIPHLMKRFDSEEINGASRKSE